MRVLNDFKFFEDADDVMESNYLRNVQGSSLILQVDGSSSDFKINVYGKANLDSSEYFKLQAVNFSDFEISQDIKYNGVYNISIEGIAEIYLDLASILDGSVTVYGKVGE